MAKAAILVRRSSGRSQRRTTRRGSSYCSLVATAARTICSTSFRPEAWPVGSVTAKRCNATFTDDRAMIILSRPRVKIRVSLCKIERDCLGQATRQIKKNAVICRAGTQSVPRGPDRKAARLGLEPRTTEPESAVLPITPSGSVRLILRDAGKKARFALPDRKVRIRPFFSEGAARRIRLAAR